MVTRILTSDLHLTDEPLDEYRWGFFPWLIGKIANLGSGIKELYILGDLTQNKDRHSAKLVNRVVNSIVDLYQKSGVHKIYILRGNHDGLGDVAYFEFMRRFSFIEYITQPTEIQSGISKVLLLPHTKTPTQDWAALELGAAKLIFMHHTFTGAKSETGYELEGNQDVEFLKRYKAKIYSGDVHVPQNLGKNIIYVGAPYPIRFGDSFKGRVLVLGDTDKEWHYPTVHKRSEVIKGFNGLELATKFWCKGDQIKLQLQIPRSEFHTFEKTRAQIVAYCAKHGFILCGVSLTKKPTLGLKGKQIARKIVTSQDALRQYVRRTKTPADVAEVGETLLKSTAGPTRSSPVERSDALGIGRTGPVKKMLRIKSRK